MKEFINKNKVWLTGIILFIILFTSFAFNSYKIVYDEWFRNQSRDVESWMVARLLQSEKHGILSNGGLAGYFHTTGAVGYDSSKQYLLFYADNIENDYVFETYNSQICGQGMFFSVLNELFPFSQKTNFFIFQTITALLTSVAMILIVYWVYFELGIYPAILSFISVFFSSWLLVFSKLIWWNLWAFYLPMIFLMYFLKNERRESKTTLLFITVSISIFIKCLFNGYEYITTTILMAITPLVYYALTRRYALKELLKKGLIFSLAMVSAVMFSFIILCFQIGEIKGGFSKGIEHIVYSVEKRTYAVSKKDKFTKDIVESQNSSLSNLLNKYLDGKYFNLEAFLYKIGIWSNPVVKLFQKLLTYRYIILITLISGIVLVCINKNNYPVVLTTCFSILAPLSWLIIFKGHSYQHPHMNYIVWQMPFTIFAFTLIGMLLDKMKSIRFFQS